jgi:hypothetical protein
MSVEQTLEQLAHKARSWRGQLEKTLRAAEHAEGESYRLTLRGRAAVLSEKLSDCRSEAYQLGASLTPEERERFRPLLVQCIASAPAAVKE